MQGCSVQHPVVVCVLRIRLLVWCNVLMMWSGHLVLCCSYLALRIASDGYVLNTFLFTALLLQGYCVIYTLPLTIPVLSIMATWHFGDPPGVKKVTGTSTACTSKMQFAHAFATSALGARMRKSDAVHGKCIRNAFAEPRSQCEAR